MQQGIQQGMQQGIEAGREDEKREIARALLDVLPMVTISEKTGLTLEEIQQLRS